ncbi:hypothetical protein [Methylomagnum ishizawai]|uniref:hypothetical protein n=1 Tax=Methylomagnum ishizawai TaxID=1760988 RepID=UPI001C334F13|nr:hypothetical protein [Methylomagnum ishizawai]BBL76541.1 hypothetical protein MishRS11D_36390 [Methylomagnum ishizawai]
MSSETNPSFLVDGIKTIAIHNDVARIQFMQLGNDGKPEDAMVLLVPLKQVGQISEALRNIRK